MKTQNILIVYPSNDEQVTVLKAFLNAHNIKFEFSKEDAYYHEFVAKIEKSRQDYINGKGKVYTSDQLNELWK